MARIGIMGPPNVGKTTLFNALTGLEAPTAPHPFSTTEPNVGVARVPDPDLEAAAELEGSGKVVHATLELLDGPAIATSGHGAGLSSRYLGRLREMDGLAAVVRAFQDDRVPADESGTDPLSQAQDLSLELTLADLEVFDRRRERLAKEASADPAMRPAAAAVAEASRILQEGTPLRAHRWGPEELAAFRDLAPLTLKPVVWVINVSEDDGGTSALVESLDETVPDGDTVVGLSAELEEEASRLPAEDREEFFEGFGMGEGALTTIVRASYRALGLTGFYTLSSRESHAWAVRRGARVAEAAGRVHSDFERGFIRAEVAPIGVVISDGGWEAAKRAGHVRVEGKDYTVTDGDVILVRFSV